MEDGLTNGRVPSTQYSGAAIFICSEHHVSRSSGTSLGSKLAIAIIIRPMKSASYSQYLERNKYFLEGNLGGEKLPNTRFPGVIYLMERIQSGHVGLHAVHEDLLDAMTDDDMT